MDEIEVFELDEEFDPLEDAGLTPDEEVEEHDYLTPIPDAELSVVPEPPVLSPEEKLAKLLAGTPGQKHRILQVIALCEQPSTIEQISEQLELTHPQKGSVYDAGRLVQLLVEAEGLERVDGDEAGEGELAGESEPEPAVSADDGGAPLEVTLPDPGIYQTTDHGRTFAAARTGMAPIEDLLEKEPVYLPIYQRVLQMMDAQGGCSKLELNKAVDTDELCQEPRRFAEYFLFRLEDAGAAHWDGAWKTTELGSAVLNTYDFDA